MSRKNDIPDQFPVRRVGEQQWEVLLVPENMWLACENEDAARVIARAPVLEYRCESLPSGSLDHSLADDCENTAIALERRKIGFGARFFRRRAQELRGHME